MEAHHPVLLAPALERLSLREAGIYIDATFGRGGHSAAILERLGPEGRLIAIDRDPQAVAWARERFRGDGRFEIVSEAFAMLGRVALDRQLGGKVDGVLFDLGVSSPQLDDPERGFSFRNDGPLDMRMDPDHGESAADWLARAEEREIIWVLREYGEERDAKRIARAIIARRAEQPITRTADLAELVAGAQRRRRPQKIHPATRTFQAIRIHVNEELQQVRQGLVAAHDVLAPGGRLVAISFHSLEDRLVKRYLRDRSQEDEVYRGLPEVPLAARPTMRLVGKAARADEAECQVNPRARSAVLRAAERLDAEGRPVEEGR